MIKKNRQPQKTNKHNYTTTRNNKNFTFRKQQLGKFQKEVISKFITTK